MKDKLLKIIDYYGWDKQLKYIHSEYFELDEAILDYENYIDLVDMELNTKTQLKNHIAEEIADVMVMLKQFQYAYNISDKYIEDMMNIKIDRQLDRIKDGEDNG